MWAAVSPLSLMNPAQAGRDKAYLLGEIREGTQHGTCHSPLHLLYQQAMSMGKGRKHHTGLQNLDSPPPPQRLCQTAQGSSLASPPSLCSDISSAEHHCPHSTPQLASGQLRLLQPGPSKTASEQVCNQNRVHLTNHIIKY